jgi:hypothetical protein
VGGVREATDVADLVRENGRHHRPDAVDGLDRPVAGVARQAPALHALDHHQLPVVDAQEVPQGLHPGGVGTLAPYSTSGTRLWKPAAARPQVGPLEGGLLNAESLLERHARTELFGEGFPS